MFNIDDYVTRKSYNNDIVFKIIDIKDDIYYLKGICVRLLADSKIEDLNKFEDEIKEDEEFLERIKIENKLERDDYFYLPGKILHIDAVFFDN